MTCHIAPHKSQSNIPAVFSYFRQDHQSHIPSDHPRMNPQSTPRAHIFSPISIVLLDPYNSLESTKRGREKHPGNARGSTPHQEFWAPQRPSRIYTSRHYQKTKLHSQRHSHVFPGVSTILPEQPLPPESHQGQPSARRTELPVL